MEATRDFVFQKFSEYYRDPSTIIPSPILPAQREFAYLLFKERFMVRHKRFEGIDSLRSVLSQTVPSDVYHSCAYY
jgi:DNA primase catalytic subunit